MKTQKLILGLVAVCLLAPVQAGPREFAKKHALVAKAAYAPSNPMIAAQFKNAVQGLGLNVTWDGFSNESNTINPRTLPVYAMAAKLVTTLLSSESRNVKTVLANTVKSGAGTATASLLLMMADMLEVSFKTQTTSPVTFGKTSPIATGLGTKASAWPTLLRVIAGTTYLGVQNNWNPLATAWNFAKAPFASTKALFTTKMSKKQVVKFLVNTLTPLLLSQDTMTVSSINASLINIYNPQPSDATPTQSDSDLSK